MRTMLWWTALIGLCAAQVNVAAEKVDVYVNPLEYIDTTAAMMVGQPAPSIEVSEWLGGKHQALFQPGTQYVVEFMASWCAPCRKSLPHMSDLADRYRERGVVFIAVAAAEEGDAAGLKSLVREGSIRFPIAYVEDQEVYRNWMQAGRTFGLPWVFLVNADGRIAWWGQPFFADFEPALAAMVAGDQAGLSTFQKALKAPRNASQGWAMQRDFEVARAEQDWIRALKLVDSLGSLDLQRYWWEQIEGLRIADVQLHDSAATVDRARRILASSLHNNPHALTELAEALGDESRASEQRVLLAMRAIQRASELTRGQNASVEAEKKRIQELSIRTR